MIPLLTGEKLEIVRSTDAEIDTTACFVEHTLSTDAVKADSEIHNYASAATGDLLAGPAAGTERRAMESCFIRNKDVVTECDITIVMNKAAADTEMWKEVLEPGQILEYESKLGFYKPDPLLKLDKMLMVNGDVINAATSWADITGLTYPILAGKTYIFNSFLLYICNATTTGARLGVNGPTAPTYLRGGGFGTVTGSVTAATLSTPTAAVSAYDTSMIGAQTTGPATEVAAYIAGVIVPSVDGIFAMRCQSEVAVASALTIRRGSWLHLREADNF